MRRPSSTRETSGLVLALVGLLGCTSGTPTKLCGAVGQPCCLASACDEGGRCGGDNLCAACGDRDQLCCAGDVCNGGFTCTGRLCTASLVCPTQCTVGTSQCTGGGGIETCIASGVCPEWRTVVAACPADTSCVAASGQADCVEKCAGACTVSALVCSATGLQECLQGPTDACPVLKPKVETTVRSLCVAGATAAPDFGWESPTPFAASSVKIAVNAANDIYVLDGYGNIIHGLLGEWTYELRPTPNKKLRALATCTVPSYAFAAGQGGTVFLRRGGLWLEEYVGQDVELLDIACDSLLRAVAVGRSGRIFVRSQQGTWSAVESTVTGPFNAVTLQQSGGKAWAVGAGGRVVRCDGIETPPVSCTVENVGVTTELFDVVVHERTNRVFAVGAMSTFISRGTLGTWASFPGVALLPRVTLRGVALYDRPALLEPDVMVVGDQGARWRASAGGIRTEQRPRTDVFFSSTAIAPDGHWFATEDLGTSFWYGVSLDDDSRRFGDGKPISESLVDVASAGSGRLFAVGVEGGRYRRENAAWSADTGGLALTTPLSAVAAVSANEVYAVGVQGTVYVRRAGLWSVDTTGQTTATLRDIAFDAQRVYAVGDQGAWLEKSRTGSAGWQVVNHGVSTQQLNKLAIRRSATGAAEEVVAVGNRCELLTKVGNGISRVDLSSVCRFDSLTSALFTPGGGLIIGGTEALLLQRVSGSQTFVKEFFTDVDPFLVVIDDLFYANDAVWAVVRAGGLFQRVGSQWRAYQPNAMGLGLSAGTFDARDGIFAVGEGGLVIRRSNPP